MCVCLDVYLFLNWPTEEITTDRTCHWKSSLLRLSLFVWPILLFAAVYRLLQAMLFLQQGTGTGVTTWKFLSRQVQNVWKIGIQSFHPGTSNHLEVVSYVHKYQNNRLQMQTTWDKIFEFMNWFLFYYHFHKAWEVIQWYSLDTSVSYIMTYLSR